MRDRTHAAVLALVASWAFVLLPIFTRAARAETGNKQIDRGIELYNDLEYEQAVEVLRAALTQRNLTVEELTQGYKYLALSFVVLSRDNEARDAFRLLLTVDPAFELERTQSPRALDLFAEVKGALPERESVQLTQTASPTRPKRGQPISVSIAIVDDTGAHDRVVVRYRVRGAKSYSSVIALRAGAGRYNATISGAFVAPPAIEYFVVAESSDGRILGSEGSETEPMALLVDQSEEASPIYSRWWFWAGLGALLLAGAAVGVVLTGGDGGTTNEDASVTITVDGL